jgi:hypothetical protein
MSSTKSSTNTVASSHAEVDREEFRKSFEQLLAEIDISDINQLSPDMHKYPHLVTYYISNLNRFRMLDNWSASKSKMIVGFFLILLGISCILKAYNPFE